MTTTPNMSLVLPTEGGSNDQWAVILDAIFSIVDAHTHVPGSGVKVPAAGLNINADVSWSSGGTSHNITDLLALDFKPSPAASVTGLAGALFVSDGTSGLTANELYWRTTSGTNVKFTAGTALNVAAFTGGIGGDYAATGALVVFDDATDSYWFQQQVGASVRQYARMRSADVDLYEFKANPTAGVPTNRVRLASPTALAASYALTMPAALPASLANLRVDNTGAITTSLVPGTIQHPISLAIVNGVGAALNPSNGTSPAALILNTSAAINDLPLVVPGGLQITAWSVSLHKLSATGTITARLYSGTNAGGAGTATQIGVDQTNGANNPGAITLGQSGLTTTIAAATSYWITIQGGGTTGDFVILYQVTVA